MYVSPDSKQISLKLAEFRFQSEDKLPKDLDEVRKIHKDIREVRAPRQAKKKNESTVSIRLELEV